MPNPLRLKCYNTRHSAKQGADHYRRETLVYSNLVSIISIRIISKLNACVIYGCQINPNNGSKLLLLKCVNVYDQLCPGWYLAERRSRL